MTAELKLLHECWNRVTGQELNPRATERLFYEYWKMEFTVADLECVLRYMLNFNRRHPECPMKIQVHKVLGDVEVFASVLGEARAKERNRIKPASPKQEILQSFRPVVNPELNTGNSHHISEFIKVPK